MTASEGSQWWQQQEVEGDRGGSAGHAGWEEIVCSLPQGGAHGHQASSGTQVPNKNGQVRSGSLWTRATPDQMPSLGVRVAPG